MLLFLLAAPPILWASSSIIDKCLLSGNGEDSEPSVLMAMSGLFNLLFAIVLGVLMVWQSQSIGISVMLLLMANSVTHFTAMWFYLKALKEEEASRVVPWFQIVPVFGVIGALLFLEEWPGWYAMGAIGLLITGGLFLSVKNGVAKKKMMGLMILSCLFLATNDVIFAKLGRTEVGNDIGTISGFTATIQSFWTAVPVIFADVLGKAFCGLGLVAFPKIRRGFKVAVKKKFAAQSTSESMSILADFFFDWGKLLVPVAVVQATACTAPLFTLFGTTVLGRAYPRLLAEEKGTFWQKLVGVTLVVAGGIVLSVVV